MLISQVPEEGGSGPSREASSRIDNSYEYKSASELFDLMAKKQNFQPDDDETLTTRDLVLIYKNIDLGTKLMNNANEIKRKAPNQYVETVVYEDLESDSDLSEIYSSEDIHNVVLINKERIDLLNHPPPLESSVCPKFGNFDMYSPSLSDVDKKIAFHDKRIKDQLKNLNIISKSDELNSTILPASLLDYICCKSLEDNYNFYMDNIIRYVKHTIDQLKRISNGDYLTDKAKEKWREVREGNELTQSDKHSKVLANSTSIPLYVERKVTGHVTKWDELVHSEVDIRSLSKILEKKIVVEVPKAICGSYRLFSKCRDDNIIISCKRETPDAIPEELEESRVDVVVKLNRSDSGHVISNISSIMILQKTSENATDILLPSLTYKEDKSENAEILDSKDQQDTIVAEPSDCCTFDGTSKEEKRLEETEEIASESYGPGSYETFNEYSSQLDQETEENNESDYETYLMEPYKLTETVSNQIIPDQLRFTVQRLNMQTLPEEVFEDNTSFITTNHKKSPTRKRIKSPYENKSFALEEKKRNKLLEIKQKREKKKLAMTEHKVNKQKYVIKGVDTPHTTSSVTKLPITNKSFYNSIYGKSVSANLDHDQCKVKGQKIKKFSIPESSESVNTDNNNPDVPKISIDIDKAQKYINKTYYLDEAVTEVMCMDLKKKENHLDSGSTASNDFSGITEKVGMLRELIENEDQNEQSDNVSSSYNSVPTNTPKDEGNLKSPVFGVEDPKKVNKSVEFRKSIDKIYELIKKVGKNEGGETKLFKSKFTAVTSDRSANTGGENSIAQYSDSGTSLKHLASSNPSSFSFDKVAISEAHVINNYIAEKQEPSTVVPKVIISTKQQVLNEEVGKKKKVCKRSGPTKGINTESPLRAISQLLHEFDNVQKTRSKTVSDSKINKKPEINVVEPKTDTHQTLRKSIKPDNRLKDNDTERHSRPNARDRKPKMPQFTDQSKYPHNKFAKRRVLDIVDEIKEARGEAVRGPKFNSRLNSLAQPKRTYIQAQIEDFQTRYGKNFVSDRLQKLSTPAGDRPERTLSPRHKKKALTDSALTSSGVLPPPAALEKSPKKSSNNISAAACSSSPKDQCSKPPNGDGPDSIKKKMVAVESYVNNHYGRTAAATASSVDLTSAGHKSRIPLFPIDLDLSSVSSSLADESSTIGSKLHHIIDNMIPHTITSPCRTSYLKLDKEQASDDIPNVCSSNDKTTDTDLYTRDDRSTYHCMPLEINRPTKYFKRDEIIGDTIPEETDVPQENESVSVTTNSLEAQNSKIELQKLENALYRRMSIGTFTKRLRMKNLTLTPEESLQHVLLLQAGDADNSLVLKSTISQNIKINTKTDTNLKTLSELSNIDWAYTQFPMQISTVGYSFPCQNMELKQIVEEKSMDSEIIANNTFDKTSQCFKGVYDDLLPHSAAQVDVKDLIAISSVVKVGSTLLQHRWDPVTFEKEANMSKTLPVKNNLVESRPAVEPVTSIEMAKEKVSKEQILSRDNSGTFCQSADTAINVARECIRKTPRIEYTTSLDILAGLLSEIQNITTRQKDLTTKSELDTGMDKELKTILKTGSTFGSTHTRDTCNIISITSLDKLRQLESNPSIYSLYNLSSNGDDRGSILKPMYEDKEVDAVVPMRECINVCTNIPSCTFPITAVDLKSEFKDRSTDVPSCTFPITVTHSTNITNSMIGIISEPSSQSTFTFNEHPLHYNASLTSLTKFIKHPKNQRVKVPRLKAVAKVMELDDKFKIKTCEKKNPMDNVESKALVQLSLCNKSIKSNYYAKDSDFDAITKMKRDILVTMYSVLVLTVFAALSFPEILYRA